MKATKKMIKAACEASPELQRAEVAKAIHAALEADRNTPKSALTNITILYNVLCAVLVVFFVALSSFADFNTLAVVGVGLASFLILGAVALVCAWWSLGKKS